MAQIPINKALSRFKDNEDRLDKFVNDETGYTASSQVPVESIPAFLNRVENEVLQTTGAISENVNAAENAANEAKAARDGAEAAVTQAAPSGAVAFFAGANAPDGWLKANGAAVSRTTYADLFAAIGTTYGEGDGSITFNLPDLRGEFLRGMDDGRGVDSDRVLGSVQEAALGAHNHLMFDAATWGNGDDINNLNAISYARSRALDGSYRYNIKKSDTAPNAALTSTTGGTETRPRNVALLACIKI